MTIGELIAIARECKGMTLRDLERESGISNALISQIETGKVANPGFTTVVQLMHTLGLSMDRAAKTVKVRKTEAEIHEEFDTLSKGAVGALAAAYVPSS